MFEDIFKQVELQNKEAADAMRYAWEMMHRGEYTPAEFIETLTYIEEVYVNT